MTNLMGFDPFREFDTLSNRLARILKDNQHEVNREASFAPAVDIAESAEAYHFKAELPDVKKEDIKVAIEGGILTLSGTKKHEKETKNEDKKYHRIERSWGSFYRSFQLPDSVDASRVEAKYENGILDVVVAKQKEVPEKKTQVQIK